MNSPWVVIPTYNEKKNIQEMLPVLFGLGIPNLSILVVDDNSPDGTAAVVKEFRNTYPLAQVLVREKKSGLGRAYVAGFQYALAHGATHIVQMDADFSHDPLDVPKLFKALEEHDVAIGSRYIQGISVINWPLSRLLISIGGNVYASVVTGMPFKDATGGFKAWRADVLKTLDLDSVQADGYGFQIAMNYRAWKKKFKITEVPIIFTERRVGQSKMSKSIIWEALFLVWQLRFFGK